MLEVKGLTKIYSKTNESTGEKRQTGIFNLDLVAKAGSIFGLIGANGAGKTTTMRIIAGLTKAQEGSITLNGKNYKEINNLKQKVALVSGETNIYDRTTPREILKLFGSAAGLSNKELNKKIDELSQTLQMTDFLDEQTNNFSTGMKQKTSIARALVTNPDVLIFDEVTNGLDIFASRSVKQIVKGLSQQGRIILYSTHIMPDADELCDELAIIHKGKLLKSGSKKELLSNHQNIESLFFNLIENE